MECNSPLFSTPASLSEDGFEVLCERTMYESVDNTPALSARLRLVWNGQRIIDNPQNASGMYNVMSNGFIGIKR